MSKNVDAVFKKLLEEEYLPGFAQKIEQARLAARVELTDDDYALLFVKCACLTLSSKGPQPWKGVPPSSGAQ